MVLGDVRNRKPMFSSRWNGAHNDTPAEAIAGSFDSWTSESLNRRETVAAVR